MKTLCRHCKVSEGVIVDAKTKYKEKTYTYMSCRECNAKRARDYRKTDSGKTVYREIMRRQYLTHREKILARRCLSRAIKRGDAIRPNECSACCNKKKVEGHHSDYSKPLQVVWLCRTCHAMI